MDPSVLAFGHIIIADIPDPNDQPCDVPHPAMIFRGPSDSGWMYVVGISTKVPDPLEKFMIVPPWKEGGHDETGLSRYCVLKCFWTPKIHASQVKCRIGRMPSAVAEQVLEFVISAIEEKKRNAANQLSK